MNLDLDWEIRFELDDLKDELNDVYRNVGYEILNAYNPVLNICRNVRRRIELEIRKDVITQAIAPYLPYLNKDKQALVLTI